MVRFHSLDDLHAFLYLGERRWAALTSQVQPPGPGTALTHLEVQYVHWRWKGGGPDGDEPVYTLHLRPGAPLSPVSADPLPLLPSPSHKPAETDGDEEEGQYRDAEAAYVLSLQREGAEVSAEKAARTFLETLAMPGTGAPRAAQALRPRRERDEWDMDDGSSRSRSPSPSRSRSRSNDYHCRQPSYSPSGQERSWRHRDDPSWNAMHSHGPGRHGQYPLHAGAGADAGAGAWAVGIAACEHPIDLKCLDPPATGTPTYFHLKIGKILFNKWVQIKSYRFMHEAVLGSKLRRNSRVRVVMVAFDANGRVKQQVPTMFEGGEKLQRWRDVLHAVGGMTRGNYAVFKFLGTLRMADPAFDDPEIPFFAVEEWTTKPSE